MDRRRFLASIIGLALHSTAAVAQSQQPGIAQFDPVPMLVHVKMIIVDHVSVASEDRNLLVQLDARPFGGEVAKFMTSQFNAAAYPIVCIDRGQLRHLPPGMKEADVLHVGFRLDVSSVGVANDPGVVVGTASTHYWREESGLLSWVPMTHFVVESDGSALTTQAQQALLDQAQKSIVDQIVYVKKRGF